MIALDWYILQLQAAEAVKKKLPQVLENTPYLKENSHHNNKTFLVILTT